MDTTTRYPSDLSDREWARVRRLIPAPKKGGRPAKYDRRESVNALLYITRAGSPWRLRPQDLPPCRTVPGSLMRWKEDGRLDRPTDRLRGDLRVASGKRRQPSAAILDSQSVKTTEKGGPAATTAARRSSAGSVISWSTRSA